MTWFERVKACETPEEMAELLDGGERMFCPANGYAFRCTEKSECKSCVPHWLKEDVKRLSDERGVNPHDDS